MHIIPLNADNHSSFIDFCYECPNQSFIYDVVAFIEGLSHCLNEINGRWSQLLLPDSKWALCVKVGSFYYGCFPKYRENSLHLESSVVNN